MLRRRSLPFSSLFLTCAALSLTACQDKRADDTEQVAPGLHLDKVDATKCPALGAPNKRIAIEGTPFSIASPDGFEIAQRETEVAREVIMKRTLKGEGSGSLTVRVIVDASANPASANESLKSASTTPAGPVNKTIGEVELAGQKLPIRLTDRGLDATQRVFIPKENDSEQTVTVMTGVSAMRDCHEPLTALGTEVLRSLQSAKP